MAPANGASVVYKLNGIRCDADWQTQLPPLAVREERLKVGQRCCPTAINGASCGALAVLLSPSSTVDDDDDDGDDCRTRRQVKEIHKTLDWNGAKRPKPLMKIGALL